ncbi:TlyA family RNA methyltransferase [uncultured Brevundimonas sp.]|uniref:TlyA family RNA methyltransferase n=1 Tax=uncultured Brevundimonas sp. TaxID=213418 RepID=UPI0030EDAD40|tara:strand:+ start:36191 stop:36928 length:738 start_codon:yes stop_codon:yes gene_type:complete
MKRVRLDQLLVARGLTDSRAKARAAIEAGGVTIDGVPARIVAQSVPDDAVLTVVDAHRWVGRGGLKLDHALTLWPVPVEGRVVLDIGASTGGFTEVCLARGADRVYAVDVGSEQMHPRVAAAERVINLEKTDARTLTPELIPEAPALIVCDASFIGLAKVLPAALALAGAGADLVTLVKPQFEADGPGGGGGKKGVVKDPGAHRRAVDSVSAWLEGEGWSVRETTESPITGGDGNIEFLLWAQKR